MGITASIITISDRCSKGEKEDLSGPVIESFLSDNEITTVEKRIVPDEKEEIIKAVCECSDLIHTDLIITTGGTGFSKRDVTPEALKQCIERFTPGLDEVMRAESMKITDRGCLSRGVSGIRGNSLILSLPGSSKAVRENLEFVISPLKHGIEMLRSEGSNNCGEAPDSIIRLSNRPSLDEWLSEAKNSDKSKLCGMYLSHNGVVRQTSKESVYSDQNLGAVRGMRVSLNHELAEKYASETLRHQGIFYLRYWINEGELKVGDDIMLCLIGGDTRPNVIECLETFLRHLKTECIVEEEIF